MNQALEPRVASKSSRLPFGGNLRPAPDIETAWRTAKSYPVLSYQMAEAMLADHFADEDQILAKFRAGDMRRAAAELHAFAGTVRNGLPELVLTELRPATIGELRAYVMKGEVAERLATALQTWLHQASSEN